MDIALKPTAVAVVLASCLFGQSCVRAEQGGSVKYDRSMTETYSQKTLLKNWALSVCLAKIAKDAVAREDANATASAYLEFGQQPLEAYEELGKLAERYANRKYGGMVKSDFNTMKCIDLFHSKELDRLAGKLSRTR